MPNEIVHDLRIGKNFSFFLTSETELDYYHQPLDIQIAWRVIERLQEIRNFKKIPIMLGFDGKYPAYHFKGKFWHLWLESIPVIFPQTKNIFSETRKYFLRVGKNLQEREKINFLVNYFVCILNAKIIKREKDFGCGKLLWKDTWDESFMFWLRK